MKVAHLTSVHPRFDVRIFRKMCSTLSRAGHRVTLIVADGLGDVMMNGIKVVDVGAPEGRKDRILNAPGRILKAASMLDVDLYHLHDPELWRIGLRLKRDGQRVVFDAHEDIPSQILSKPYLNKASLWWISRAVAAYESWACRRFDGVIAATPFIRDKLLKVNLNTIDINNFPILGELSSDIPWERKQVEVCYVGGIGGIRGILEVVEAMSKVGSGARLNLGGKFNEPTLELAAKHSRGWSRVNELGYLDRNSVRKVLGRSMAGLVTFHPLPNHIEAQPNKIFEYMSAGIPVIASNFALWQEIVVGNDCGLCVDPMKPSEIADAIDFLVTHPERAMQMGMNGRQAVANRYNWTIEERKLLAFYEEIQSRDPA